MADGRKKRSAMEDCALCNAEIKPEEKFVKCILCNVCKHVDCAGMSDACYKKFQKSPSYYCSTSCEIAHTSQKKMDELLLTMRRLQTSIDKIDSKYLSKSQSDIKLSVEEVKTSQAFISDKYDEIMVAHGKIEAEMASVVKTTDDHEQELVDLNLSLSDMKKRLRVAEQVALKNELIVNGVPKSLQMDEATIITKVAAAVGVQLLPSEISKVYRVRNGMIHVDFNNSKARNDLLAARKGKSLYLDEVFDLSPENTTQSPSSGPSSPLNRKNHVQLFINENLTRETRFLFREAKGLRSHGFKFVWCNNGVIYCKRDETTQLHIIDSVEDVRKLHSSPKKK
uniref:(northern house mosquito) hypothetical protein n=1 Tax=Culex pipiens TaxID=7175 RepID=A0A8D8JWS1_CULPI